MAIYRGIAEVLLGPASIRLPSEFTTFGNATALGSPVPYSLILLAAMAVLSGVLLGRTVLGRWIYSVGTNERAAVFSGVPSGRVVTIAFILSGAFAGMGGLLVAARLGVARFDSAKGMELDAITAVVLGGASIFGGSGSIFGTVLALLVLAVLQIGMGVANVTQEYQLAVIGTLLVAAVAVGAVFQRQSRSD
jgi:ribose/xylose/arabinose/galactoside ABC-type transport system permease subunit